MHALHTHCTLFLITLYVQLGIHCAYIVHTLCIYAFTHACTSSGDRGCHCCMHLFKKILGTSGGQCRGQCGVNNRCGLHPNDKWRTMPRFGVDSTNPARNQPPKTRTHDETVAAGEYLSFFGRGTKLTPACWRHG